MIRVSLIALVLASLQAVAYGKKSQTRAISNQIKIALYNKVIDDIWFEDEGSMRTIRKKNLKFKRLKSTKKYSSFSITGSESNDWDGVPVDYDCIGVVRKIAGKEPVTKRALATATAASCILENENWPKADTRLSLGQLKRVLR